MTDIIAQKFCFVKGQFLVISRKLVVNAHILDSSALEAKATRLSDRPPDRNVPNSPDGLTDMVATV